MKKWNELTERAVEWEFTEGDPSVWRYKDNTPVDTAPLGDGEKFAAIREDMSLRLYENNDTNGRLIPYIMTEGGSSVSACTGNNEYESTYHHYMKKVGVDDSLSDASKEDTFFRGHVEEEPTAQYFIKIMKVKYDTEVVLENDTYMYGNQKYPGARVNLDRRIRMINGKHVNGGLEIKTAGPFSEHAELFKKGKLPAAYEDQVRFYMAVMNIDFFYVIGRWGMELADCAIILIRRDKEIEKHLMGAYLEFYDCVENGIEPSEMSKNAALLMKDYIRLHGVPDKKRGTVELPDTAKTVIEEAMGIDKLLEQREEDIKSLKARKQEILSALLPYLADDDGSLAAYASCRMDEKTVAGITVKISEHKAGFNVDLLKAQEPEIYERFQKNDIDVTKLKARAKTIKFSKEFPSFNIEEYIIPAEPDITKAPTLSIKLREKEIN